MLPDKNRAFFPLPKELGEQPRGGCMLQKQRAAGHQHPEPCGHLLKGKRSPKIILLEFHLQPGCPWGKLTGAAYKKGLESAVQGKPRRETPG